MCERRRPPKAVEGRDKRGEEEHSEADPAQAEAEGSAAGYPGRGGRRCGVCGRELTDPGAVLLYADDVRGGEEDEESTNIDG